MLQGGHSGDGCVLASTLFMYDLRKGDLFVLSWAGVRRVRPGSLSSDVSGTYRTWKQGLDLYVCCPPSAGVVIGQVIFVVAMRIRSATAN